MCAMCHSYRIALEEKTEHEPHLPHVETDTTASAATADIPNKHTAKWEIWWEWWQQSHAVISWWFETNVAYIPLWNALLGNMWLTRYLSVKSIILFFLRNPHLLVINEILKNIHSCWSLRFFLIQPLIYVVIAGLDCRCISLSENIFKIFLLFVHKNWKRSESIYSL